MLINKRFSCTLVIPVFQNENNINLFHKELLEFISDLPLIDLALIYIDDGSSDETFSAVSQLKFNTQTILVKLDTNYGQTTAISIGLALAKSDLVLIKSADLQDSLNVFRKTLLQYEISKQDILFVRKTRNDKLSKRFFSNVFYTTIRLFAPKIPKGGFDTVLLTKDTYTYLVENFYLDRFLQLDIINAPGIKKIVYYERKGDKYRKSSWSFLKSLSYALKAFLITINLVKPKYIDIRKIILKAEIKKINS